MLTNTQIHQARLVLKPTRRAGAFEFAMQRWALLLSTEGYGSTDAPMIPCDETDGDFFVGPYAPPNNDLVEAMIERTTKAPPNRRNIKNTTAHYAALLLAVIFHEHTGRKPTRVTVHGAGHELVTVTIARDKSSPFYRFATECFSIVGLHAHEVALRGAAERWEKSRDFSRLSMRQLLYRQRLPKLRTRKRQ